MSFNSRPLASLFMGKDYGPQVSAAFHTLYCEAVGDLCEAQLPNRSQAQRKLWEGVLAVLTAYISKDNRFSQADPNHDRLQQFPIEVAAYLENVVKEILTGKTPDAISIMRSQAPPKYGPAVVDAKNMAVLYAKAVKIGLVNDKTPAKTICGKFQIKPQTWKEWRSKADASATNPDNFRPDDDASLREEAIKKALGRAATIYLKRGRPDTPQIPNAQK